MRPSIPDLSPTTRKVGALHLLLAGAINGVAGSGVLLVARGGTVRHEVVWALDRFVAPGVLLDLGPGAVDAVVAGMYVVGALLLALALLQVGAARLVYLGRRKGVGILAGVAGTVTLVSLPWSLASVVLVYLTRDQFVATGAPDTDA